MDITFKRVYQSSQAAVQAGCSNVSVFLYNALFLDQLFPKSFLDGVVIFFPDPWKSLLCAVCLRRSLRLRAGNRKKRFAILYFTEEKVN